MVTPSAMYAQMVAAGTVQHDTAQAEAMQALDKVYLRVSDPEFEQEDGIISKLLSSVLRPELPEFCGTYLWGDVGRGKSMLMDIFYEMVPIKAKRRVHFHAFMREVHARIHAWRQLKSQHDLLPRVVDELAREAKLLCFDEFQVHDVTDAMILSRLFTLLFQKGVVVVTTSNRAPKDLYQGGLQREQFEQFIELAEAHLDIVRIDGPLDYRLQQLKAFEQVYYPSVGEEACEFLYDAYCALTQSAESRPTVVEVQGRNVVLEKTASGVAWVSFAELCERPLGAGDYLEIAALFHTLIMQDIPILSPEKRNEAKRFVTLIDTLYEHKVKLICSAQAPAEALYPAGDGSFEFQRTVSRLMEMQSERYLSLPHISE